MIPTVDDPCLFTSAPRAINSRARAKCSSRRTVLPVVDKSSVVPRSFTSLTSLGSETSASNQANTRALSPATAALVISSGTTIVSPAGERLAAREPRLGDSGQVTFRLTGGVSLLSSAAPYHQANYLTTLSLRASISALSRRARRVCNFVCGLDKDKTGLQFLRLRCA